jgi:hypothetical protein
MEYVTTTFLKRNCVLAVLAFLNLKDAADNSVIAIVVELQLPV